MAGALAQSQFVYIGTCLHNIPTYPDRAFAGAPTHYMPPFLAVNAFLLVFPFCMLAFFKSTHAHDKSA